MHVAFKSTNSIRMKAPQQNLLKQHFVKCIVRSSKTSATLLFGHPSLNLCI